MNFINFIKYNNAFTIIFALVLFSTGATFANEKVRDTVIGQTIITKQGTDNTQIISTNLNDFDMGLKIKSVKEDAQFYYVNFDYNAIDAKDGVWQTVKKEKNVNVLKTRLGNMDLGLYLAEELKQLTDREMAYMKEVQSIEKNRGAQKQVESVEYTGLKGLVFNNETKEIFGYDPVKENENQKAEVLGVFNPSSKSEEEKKSEKDGNDEKVAQQITVVKETVSKETIMQMVKEALAQEQRGGSSASASSSSSSSSVVSGGGSPVSSSSESLSASSSSETASSSQSSESSSAISSSSSNLEASSSSGTISSSLPAGEAGSSAESSSSVSETSSSSSEVLNQFLVRIFFRQPACRRGRFIRRRGGLIN